MNKQDINNIAGCLYNIFMDNKELVLSMIDETGSIYFGDGE